MNEAHSADSIMQQLTKLQAENKALHQQIQQLEVRERSLLQQLKQVEYDDCHLQGQWAKYEQFEHNKSVFLMNMSHELRTPLNAIIGYSEILQDELMHTDVDYFVEDVKKIRNSGSYLLRLINSILYMSKIELGKMELYNTEFTVADLLKEIQKHALPLAQRSQNQFKLYNECAKQKLFADFPKLAQVLFNLLDNAHRRTEKGLIQLRVEVVANDRIQFYVEDNGEKIADEQMKTLFVAYATTNLELPVTKHLVELMGGELTIGFNNGNYFLISLPLQSGVQSISPTATYSVKEVSHENAVVLVIDDDPDVRDILQSFLHKQGYHVALASNGDEGILLAQQLKPHIITLDVMMAGIDGWMVLSRLKNTPALAEIPVIIISAMEDKSVAYSLGAAEYLTKPVERAQINNILRKYLKFSEE